MDENKEITKSLTNEKQSLKRIQEDNIKAEEMMRERAAKAKQAKIKKEEVEKKREYKFQKNTVNLETEIDELTLEINGKRKKNIQFLRAIQKNGSELSVEKPHKIRQNVEIIKALKLMNTQVHQIK